MATETFRELVSLKEARRLCRERLADQRVDTEPVPLVEAVGRVLAAVISASAPVPHFARSIRDGYAVRASDTFSASPANAVLLQLTGAVHIGQTPDCTVESGQAAPIPTGGMLPDGADAVVMVEYADLMGANEVQIFRAAAPGQYVQQVGEDIPEDKQALAAGSVLGPSEISLLSALGETQVEVYCRPRVGIFSTGDEIVAPQVEPAPGQTRDANAYGLAAACRSNGSEPIMLGIVRDDVDELLNAARAALDDCDILLISGGSSAGTRDITQQVLAGLTAEQVFVDGIALRPGKPTIVAAQDHRLIFGLPGHPVSALIVFHRLVRPVIGWLTGTEVHDATQIAQVTRNIPSEAGLTEYVRVKLRRDNDELWAEPIFGKSASLSTLAQ
ncbi:MAG: molybdopterin molybdenumtransferase MoeA, partial [Armatimonadetes bacterium]|nr:molybdopterin molybdenumtransferase MoeA [Armatimonadota bacterium]